MSTSQSDIARDCWKKGTQALEKQSWDYAIEMFQQSVRIVPDNLMYRQTLRGALHRKYGNNMSGAKMANMKLMGIRNRLKKARSKQNWAEADQIAVEGLIVNPWNAQINADMGEACHQLGYDAVAADCYERAVEAEPENRDYLRSLADIYEERGEYHRAGNCWAKIVKLDPLDGEARSKETQLQAKQVMDRGGYEKAETTREVKAKVQSEYDHDLLERQAAREQQASEGPGDDAETDMLHAIRKEPENKAHYLKLATFYRRAGRLEDARVKLNEALEVSVGDTGIREQLEDVELDILRTNVESAKEHSRENAADEKAKKKYKGLAGELLQREIEVFSSRVERYPADMRMKFQLAQKFMKIGKTSSAIPLLQKAVTDSRIEPDVLVALGKCFVSEKKHSLARRQFEKAIPKISHDEKPETFKEANYLLGRICEAAKDFDLAEQYYSEVLAVDYEYRDTLKRLEDMQSGDE